MKESSKTISNEDIKKILDEYRKGELLTDSLSSDSDYTLKERVFLFMERYPTNKSNKELCRFLKIEYYPNRDVVKQYKSQWRKGKSKNRQLLKCLKFHSVYFTGKALTSMNANMATKPDSGTGWKITKALNGMVKWRDNTGHIQWFPSTGTIKCWVKKPASKGKMINLLCNAFLRTGVVLDYDLFNSWKDSFVLYGFHLVLETGKHVPKARIGLLKGSNGVVFVAGDSSHPTGYELQVICPEWAQRNEVLLAQAMKCIELNSSQIQQFTEFMKRMVTPKPLSRDASGLVR